MRNVISFRAHRSRSLVGIGAATVAVTAVLGFFVGQTGSAGPPSLRTVDPTALEAFGLELRPPAAANPVAKVTAESVAREQYPNRRVLEAVLAECVGQQVNGTCWLVSMDPAGLTSNAGPPSHPRKPESFRFLVVIVDAQSGEFLRSLSAT
jgi:hypothetical protein